jgi:hypothetical protein
MRRSRLSLQPLDERINPVVWNTPWADPGNITLSFAPDGTAINGSPSALNQELAAIPTATWQKEVLRAFQTWAAQAGMNVSVVADDGGAFGGVGPLQGDARRGDIRIGARSLGATELAITTPFDQFGGWSGEVVLNTDKAFNLGAAAGKYDLYTVFVQEAGHAFGLPNSTSTSSVMYTTYSGVKTGLSATDVTAIKSLYGARPADALEGAFGNGTTATAKSLTFISNVGALSGTDGTLGTNPFVAAGDLTSATDVDVYKVTSTGTSFGVSLKTTGLSLLAAKVTVTNAFGMVVGTATATGPGKDLTVNVTGAAAGATYYVKVEKADAAFAVGRYRLAVGSGTNAQTAVNDPVIAGLVKNDGHGNDIIYASTNLGTQATAAGPRWDFSARATLQDTTDVDFYTFKTGATPGAALIVSAWGTTVGGVDPVITVYNAFKQVVAAEVLTNDAGAYVVQVKSPAANSTYYVKVAGDPKTGPKTGTYVLAADLRTAAVAPQRLSAATLTAAAPQSYADMTVYQYQLFHFALSTTTANPLVASAVRMTVRNAQGQVVYSLFANAGERVSGDVMLAPGTYTVVVTAGTQLAGVSLPSLSYTLDGMIRSDPIGLSGTNTSTSPTGSTTTTTTTTKPYTGTYSSPYTAM